MLCVNIDTFTPESGGTAQSVQPQGGLGNPITRIFTISLLWGIDLSGNDVLN